MIKEKEFIDLLKSKLSEIKNELGIEVNINHVTDGFESKSITLTAKEKTPEKVLERACRAVGFGHNVIGMTFKGRTESYKILSVNNRKRKYKVNAMCNKTGKVYGFPVDYVKKQLGGDVYINRIKTISKILNDKK